MKNPCRDCAERYEACHDKCEKRAEWLTEHIAEKEWLRKMTFTITSKAAERAFREKLRNRRR